MYRTGPFIQCQSRGIQPDILALGKGLSDMMVPMAGTMLSQKMIDALARGDPDFVARTRRRNDTRSGYVAALSA
ncbi:MAG: hypothetical protein AAGD07_20950 [Planctomycetota bacterium]